MFEFFRTWLVVVGVAMAVAGTALAVLAGTPLTAALNRLLDRPFWTGEPDAATRRFQAWSHSVTFATMAGWGLCVAIVAANAFGSRQAWAWWAIAGSVALWFPLDTGRSLYHRVYANVAVNIATLVVLATPLIGTFGEFH